MNHSLGGKIIYWTICTFLILGIFFLFFGVVPLFFLKGGTRDHVKMLASLFAVLGLIMLAIAVHRPGLAWKTFFIKSEKALDASFENQKWLGGLGVCFTVGGLLYAYTGNISAVIGLFFIFTVVMGILKR
jgi:hypothetical protein